ncbi:hypothetical protein EYF80_010009 [Liparis tanakae]|uniref:Uncharacterized protein n=1 Tax=Liparis tanakae TaxID=230148 RepID=A0A4Z2IPF5_9TELE|nr:hypothetical protein EYF80_010009 [Liparis tanakae]
MDLMVYYKCLLSYTQSSEQCSSSQRGKQWRQRNSVYLRGNRRLCDHAVGPSREAHRHCNDSTAGLAAFTEQRSEDNNTQRFDRVSTISVRSHSTLYSTTGSLRRSAQDEKPIVRPLYTGLDTGSNMKAADLCLVPSQVATGTLISPLIRLLNPGVDSIQPGFVSEKSRRWSGVRGRKREGGRGKRKEDRAKHIQGQHHPGAAVCFSKLGQPATVYSRSVDVDNSQNFTQITALHSSATLSGDDGEGEGTKLCSSGDACSVEVKIAAIFDLGLCQRKASCWGLASTDEITNCEVFIQRESIAASDTASQSTVCLREDVRTSRWMGMNDGMSERKNGIRRHGWGGREDQGMVKGLVSLGCGYPDDEERKGATRKGNDKEEKERNPKQ